MYQTLIRGQEKFLNISVFGGEQEGKPPRL
jgi:hypothetical protein